MKAIVIVLIFFALVAAFYFTGSSPAPATNPGATTAPAASPSAGGTQGNAAKDSRLTEDNPVSAPKGNGSLKGVVKYDGDPPAVKMLDILEKDQPNCHNKAVEDESLVVDKASKGLKWAIIRIMDSKAKDAPPPPATPYTMTQKGCTFTPHVVIVPPNTDLMILNPDNILHNIHTTPYDSDNPGQNPATTTDLTYKAKWLQSADLIAVECNIHSWMKGFILCHDPRYCAVSAADGTFEIKDLPPGTYKVNIWHEKFGIYLKKDTIDVVINPGKDTDLGELKFTPKK